MASGGPYADALARFEGASKILHTLSQDRIQGSRFLDAGCGVGNALLAASQAGAAEIVGIDRNLTEFGYNFLPEIAGNLEIRTDRIQIVEADFCSHQLEGLFDVITCFDVLEHVHDPESFIQNMRRHLADDGIAVIDIPPLYYSPVGHHLFSYSPEKPCPGSISTGIFRSSSNNIRLTIGAGRDSKN